jgi:hypothetical protein
MKQWLIVIYRPDPKYFWAWIGVMVVGICLFLELIFLKK